jgi:hypothetical protein
MQRIKKLYDKHIPARALDDRASISSAFANDGLNPLDKGSTPEIQKRFQGSDHFQVCCGGKFFGFTTNQTLFFPCPRVS